MPKIKIYQNNLTLGEGCNIYIDYCKQRNLRPATIKHYQQSYLQLRKCFDFNMPLRLFSQGKYNSYVIYLKEHLHNDISINAYLRDLITTLHYLMDNDYMPKYKMQSIKVDKTAIATYTEQELIILLEKPDIKKCSFIYFEAWVISCFLLSTGIRQHSLMELRIKDIDFDNSLLTVRVTKTRKPLLIPLNQSIIGVLHEFLRYRQYKSIDDWLFCNAFGAQLKKSTSYHILYQYNKSKGVETTGLHRYRHTFAKQWIINGGNVATLSRILGHSNLNTTQNYINLLVSDIAKQVNEIDLLNQFSNNKFIRMRGKHK